MKTFNKFFQGDRVIWVVVALLALTSLLAVYSATGTYANSEHDGNNVYVASDKTFTVTGDAEKYYINVLNKQTEVKLRKVDNEGNYVEGASFIIIDFEGVEYYQIPSTTKGDISIKNELDQSRISEFMNVLSRHAHYASMYFSHKKEDSLKELKRDKFYGKIIHYITNRRFGK